MKISIITPSYNSEKTIRKTIESVLVQEYKDIEYIIVDGLSSDKTLEIVKEYSNRISIRVISEKDNGIYDAMNKGIKLASGEVVGILNSDDFFDNKDVINKVAETFLLDESLDACYGNIVYFKDDDYEKKTRFWKSGDYSEEKINIGWAIPHPALFIKKTIYDRFGCFNTSFKIAGDYDLILRFFKINKIKSTYINETITRMREGGASGGFNRIDGWKELRLAWKVNNLEVPKFFIIKRILYKLHQLFV